MTPTDGTRSRPPASGPHHRQATRGTFATTRRFGRLAAHACRLTKSFSHRGYLETVFSAFPQEARGDSGRFIGETVLRYEPALRFSRGLSLHGAAWA